MGYGGVISLKQTIQRLLDSSKFTLDSSTRQILGFAYKEATSLQELLGDCNGRGKSRLDRLDGQIRETVHKLEDFLELHQSDLFLDEDNLSIQSERVRQEISWFSERAKKLGEDYGADADEEEDDAAPASSSNTGFCEEMVGFSDDLRSMKGYMISTIRPDDWGAMMLVGPAGTGRSLAAKKVLDDVCSCGKLCFDHGAWVSVGPNYKRARILKLILTQILMVENGWSGEIEFLRGGEEGARLFLWLLLSERRYMIVLDDVCDIHTLDDLLSLFPQQNNGSVVLVTTAVKSLRNYGRCAVYQMGDEDDRITFVDEIWDLLRLVLFPVQPAPPELEEAGRKILRNCRGLRLCFTKVLVYLWSSERSPEAWNEIACDQHHPLFRIADEFSEIRKIEEELANLTFIESDTSYDTLNGFVRDIAYPHEAIKKMLFPERFIPNMDIISFLGMAGAGKTTFVKKIFEYLRSLQINFDHWVFVWIYLGPNYQAGDILIDILAQTFPHISKTELKGDVELANNLSRQLLNKKILIVLDDVWSEAPLHNLAELFPNIKGRALVTTRFAEVGKSKIIDIIREMRFLSREESWDLLRQKVFCNGSSCSRELEKAGKKIAENCDGLPLTIVKVAKLMSKDLSPQYWNDVAKKNSDFTNVLRELSKELQPCYESLPLYLKPCFLYMGVFPQNCEVSTTKVLQLWTAEGFLEPGLSQTDDDFAAQCLLELVNRSLVMVCNTGTSSYGVKTCRLNSVLWHLSNDEAAKSQFFHAYDSVQGMKNQRRFCIRNCILLRIKDIHDSMMDSVATARSLLCTGPYHQYQLPVCFQLRLLKVLDTLVIRFYEFPIEVVKLFHLRHLAITCDGNLPTSISELWNLQFLIVSRHLRIKSFGESSSYLPMEIWDMKELRHLQVTGSSMPTPSCGTILPNLVTLLDMSPESCIEKVLKAIPNLKKLGVRIELAPGDAKPYHYLNDHISNSHSRLESLKCVVLNPEVGFEVVAPPPPLSMFPSSLVKLSLSGLGYPWSYMKIICCSLVNLEVLKLKCYAFQGDKWELGDYAFKKLKHLGIEDTDLVCWKITFLSIIELRHLSIKHCYNLEELPCSMVQVEMIEVIDCNPFTVKWEKQMRKRRPYPLMPMAADMVLNTHVESSWDDARRQGERLVISFNNFSLIADIF